ncbi:MAG: hypothetical protein ACVCEJ_11035 [Candidatus Izemoplasmataceae bacterium]
MKKLLISLVLIFFISISTMKAYAYYEDANTTYITESKPQELLSQKLVTEEGKKLVPTGSILGVDDVEEVVFVYQVFVQNGLSIDVEQANLLFNNQAQSELENLFNFDFTIIELESDSLHTNLFEGSEDGYFVEITLTLSMNTPTLDQYKLVANNVMTFDVLFQSK